MALTVKKVNKLCRRGKRGKYLDRDGLYLQVMSSTNCSWILRYELRRKKHEMGLGSVKDFPLEQARKRMREQRRLLADGIDPLEVRQQEKAKQAAADARNKTFATVAGEYYDRHSAAWSSKKFRADFMSSLKIHAFPTLGGLPIAAPDVPLVKSALELIWMTKPVTAARLQRSLSAIFDFAIAAGYRSDNPAKWKGNLKHLLPAPKKIARVQHLEAMPYAELPAFMAELRNVPGVAARALEFAIRCSSRSDEVIGAQLSEIDLEQRLWIIPPERMKGRREHRVPLSNQCLTLLRALPREAGNPNIFIGAKTGSSLGENALLKALRGLRSDGCTVHGFRSAFRDWVAERTSYPREAAEQALAHTVAGATEAAYRRTTLLEVRTRLMQQWSDYCDAPSAGASVTPLRRSSG